MNGSRSPSVLPWQSGISNLGLRDHSPNINHYTMLVLMLVEELTGPSPKFQVITGMWHNSRKFYTMKDASLNILPSIGNWQNTKKLELSVTGGNGKPSDPYINPLLSSPSSWTGSFWLLDPAMSLLLSWKYRPMNINWAIHISFLRKDSIAVQCGIDGHFSDEINFICSTTVW